MVNPKVSVIVPVYNVEEYLERCINSILNQTYRNIEIILVDDGATDESGKICDDYEKKDERIRVIHKKNGGLSSARNAALDVVRGEFITFVDSDDYISNYYIELLYKALCDANADISVCDFKKGTENNYSFKKNNYSKKQVFLSEACLEQWHSHNKKNETVAWGKLYKADLFGNIRFPVGKIHEDIYVTHCLVARARKICFIKTELYYYFQRAGSIIKENSLEKVKNHSEAMRNRLEWFYEHGYNKACKRLLMKYYENIVYYYITIHDRNYRKILEENFNEIMKFFVICKGPMVGKITCRLIIQYINKRG